MTLASTRVDPLGREQAWRHRMLIGDALANSDDAATEQTAVRRLRQWRTQVEKGAHRVPVGAGSRPQGCQWDVMLSQDLHKPERGVDKAPAEWGDR